MRRQLPGSWADTILETVTVVTQGQSPPGSSYNVEGIGLPFFQGKAEFGAVSPTVAKWCSEPTKIAHPGDVLISIRAPVGPTNLTEITCCIGRGLAAITPLGGVPSKFYLYYLRHSVSELVRQATGTTFKAVSGKQLRSHPVFLPPLGETYRIVDVIESYLTRLDDAVATLERVERNLKRYRASVLKAAVEGRLVLTEVELAREEGRDYEPATVLLERILKDRRRRWVEDAAEKGRAKVEEKAKKAGQRWTAEDNAKTVEAERIKAATKYKEPAGPDTDGLPELPEGWCWVTMPQIGELNRGKSKHRPRNDPRLLGGEYPFIQTGDVRHSTGFIREYTATYSEFGLAQSRLWPAGTLCITIAANIAETGILTFDGCFPDSVVGFLNQEQQTVTRYLELFLRTAKQELNRYAPATAQKNINLKVLSELAVPLPPAAEQERLVAEIDRLLSVATGTSNVALQNRKRSHRLRQSILKWAFEGKLVDQDLDDEPASVLIERIKVERRSKPARKTTAKAAAKGR